MEARFPLTAKYNEDWINQNSILHNVLYYAESLCKILPLHAEDKVLDLGCGKAASSIFLAKEFGCRVWAVDREVSPTENYRQAVQMQVADSVFPISADARQLPFPFEFFEAVISIDSFSYYSTDDWYLPYLAQFIKPGGYIGVSEWTFKEQFNRTADVPDYLKPCYLELGFHNMHSIEWWVNHFEKTGLFTIEIAEVLPENDFILADYIRQFESVESERLIIEALKQDKSGLIRAAQFVAKRTGQSGYLGDFENSQFL